MPSRTFKMSGEYKNDCPLCKHHNALLLKTFLEDGSEYECRDCKKMFKWCGGDQWLAWPIEEEVKQHVPLRCEDPMFMVELDDRAMDVLGSARYFGPFGTRSSAQEWIEMQQDLYTLNVGPGDAGTFMVMLLEFPMGS